MEVLSIAEIENYVRILLKKYNAESALLFGSYARGEATAKSDIDLIVFGGPKFKRCDIFAFAEELRQLTNRGVDAFEISEVNEDSEFHKTVMREGRLIA